MHTLLLVTHIVSMTASMALMAGAVILGLLGRTSGVNVATIGMVSTAVGAVTGSILLLFDPLLSQCVVLTAYLAGVTALYAFGFGSGFAENARFIRNSAPVQKR